MAHSRLNGKGGGSWVVSKSIDISALFSLLLKNHGPLNSKKRYWADWELNGRDWIRDCPLVKSELQCALLIDSAFLWSGFPQVSAIFEQTRGGNLHSKPNMGNMSLLANLFRIPLLCMWNWILSAKNHKTCWWIMYGGGGGVLFVMEFKRIHK